MGDIDRFLQLKGEHEKYYMSYSRINNTCKVTINFDTLRLSSASKDNKSYHSSQNVEFDGYIKSAIINDMVVKNTSCTIVFPAKSFLAALCVYGITDKEIRSMTVCDIQFKRMSQRRYDIKTIKRN